MTRYCCAETPAPYLGYDPIVLPQGRLWMHSNTPTCEDITQLRNSKSPSLQVHNTLYLNIIELTTIFAYWGICYVPCPKALSRISALEPKVSLDTHLEECDMQFPEFFLTVTINSVMIGHWAVMRVFFNLSPHHILSGLQQEIDGVLNQFCSKEGLSLFVQIAFDSQLKVLNE